MESPRIQRALISVSDKTGLADFAAGLVQAGVEIFSTGGTARFLQEHDIPVRDIASYTGFPEMMDGRLKTLHPRVFGGVLARHDRPDDLQALADHEIASFELVVVNLYPFEATVSRQGVTEAEAIEQIDIGGPSLVRAAAKNHAFVTIVTSPEQYADVLEAVQQQGTTSLEQRRHLAGAAFERTAAYDQAISGYFLRQLNLDEQVFPRHVHLSLQRQASLRYGENPHQKAALYREEGNQQTNLVNARKLHGKELSYNNYLDLDSALVIVRSLPDAAAVVIKHNNPCGAASSDTLAVAAKKALDGDPLSAFGSIIGFNRPVDVETAELLATPGLFIEAIVAPSFERDALEILTTRPKWKTNVRLMEVGPLEVPPLTLQYRYLEGGLLVQDADTQEDPEQMWNVVTDKTPSAEEQAELRFAWAVVRHVKSNAIVVTRDRALAGAGAGQMSRIDSVEIALTKAEERARGGVLASDAFFPFPDSIERAALAGVTAVIQPGGSKRDEEVIDACNEHGISMVFTGRRHFKH